MNVYIIKIFYTIPVPLLEFVCVLFLDGATDLLW